MKHCEDCGSSNVHLKGQTHCEECLQKRQGSDVAVSAKVFVRLPNPPVRIEIAGRQFEMTTVARGLVAQRRECWEVGPIPVEASLDVVLALSKLAWELSCNPCESGEALCNRGTLRFRGSVVDWLRWSKTLDQYIHGERGVTCHD